MTSDQLNEMKDAVDKGYPLTNRESRILLAAYAACAASPPPPYPMTQGDEERARAALSQTSIILAPAKMQALVEDIATALRQARDEATEQAAQAVEKRAAELNRRECCGEGRQTFYDEPPECCGDPVYMISNVEAASAIRAPGICICDRRSPISDAAGWRMDAYYYSFDLTGVAPIDRILSAVACAGKSFHNTSDWWDKASPYDHLRGETPVDWIQNAANDAARELAAPPASVTDDAAIDAPPPSAPA